MNEIDRRTLFGLAGVAGAGLVLTGCSGNSSKPKPVGYCDAAGQSVRDLKPDKFGGVTQCVPKYICIVYVRFEPSIGLNVRCTYVPLTTNPTPAEVISKVRPVLHRLATTGTHNQFDKEDIELIHLGSQQIVVIYIDNDPNKIRFHYNPADFNGPNNNHSFDRTIRFVPFSSKGPTFLVRDNHAFFNIMKMDIVTTGTSLRSPVAFRLDYWNTDELGRAVTNVTSDPKTQFLYSMNIHLEMASPVSSGPQKWVPVILDPDTGNGGSEP